MKRKFHILIGSLKFFSEKLDELNVEKKIDFSTAVSECDMSKRDGTSFESKELIVISFEEYKGITEEAQQNLVSVLKNITTEDARIFLHNPIKQVTENLDMCLKGEEIELSILKQKYDYRKIDYSILDSQYEHIYRKISFHIEYKIKKPLVILLFGKSGLGKTYFVNKISRSLFDVEAERFNLGQYNNNYNIGLLFGESINSRDFSTQLKLRNSNIILLDEFDKMYELGQNSFYTLFDEGFFENNHHIVDMQNSIIFITTNYEINEEIEKSIIKPILTRINYLHRFNSLTDNEIVSFIECEVKLMMQNTKLDIENSNIIEEIKNSISGLTRSEINYRLLKYKVQEHFEEFHWNKIKETECVKHF